MQFTIKRYQTLRSTNDLARSFAEAGASEGTVIIAGAQTAGKGRHGRRWISPPGAGLYVTVVLRPPNLGERAGRLGLVAGVAAAHAIAGVSGLEARIKWPNDILIDGRKVCGILVECTREAAVVGIGINVNAKNVPLEIADTAAWLSKETGRAFEVADVENALLDGLSRVYSQYVERGIEPVLAAWKHLDYTQGRRIEVQQEGALLNGIGKGVDEEGRLILQLENGEQVALTAGEVVHAGTRPLPT